MAACPDGTPPDDMEEGVSEKKYDKNESIYEEKEAKFPDVTPPDDMEVFEWSPVGIRVECARLVVQSSFAC